MVTDLSLPVEEGEVEGGAAEGGGDGDRGEDGGVQGNRHLPTTSLGQRGL